MSLSIPFVAIVAGKLYGREVTRNLFSWIGLFLYGLLLIPFTVFVYPFLLLLMVNGYWAWERKGNTCRVTDSGIELCRKEGVIGQFEWGSIERIEEFFEPPMVYIELVLHDGQRFAVHAWNQDELKSECEKRGIPFDEKWQLR